MRMRNRIGAAVALYAGLAASARAEVNTRVEWQVSADNINWSSTLNIQWGHEVWVRALVTYTGTAQPLGLAAVVFQPTVSGWDAEGPSVDGAIVCTASIIEPPPRCVVYGPDDPTQFGRVSPFARTSLSSTTQLTGHVHSNGSGGAPPGGWLRIAQLQVTSWIGGPGNTSGGSGVPLGQMSNVGRTTSDPAFNGQTAEVLVYKFGILLGTDAAPRTMVVDAPLAGFGNRDSTTGERQVYWWGGMNEATGSIRGAPVVVPATINVRPCGSADYDHDGNAGTDADIGAFFACLAGNCCDRCVSADFDGDGDVGTDADIEAFFRVLGGGSC